MIDLDDDLSSGAVNGFDQPPDPRGELVGADEEHLRTRLALLEDARVLDGDVPHATRGAFHIVGDLPIGHHAFR